jgi:hypothetical protein
LLVILFAAGLLVALAASLLIPRTRGRLIVAAAGILVVGGWSLYIEAIASCPVHGECDKGLGVFFLLVILAGWLVGVALSWLIRNPGRS